MVSVSVSSSAVSSHRSSDDQERRLIFELHHDEFCVSGSNVELAWAPGTSWREAQAEPCRANGSRSQYSYLRATRTRVDTDTIHIAPRETHIKNVLDILALGDNKCKSIQPRESKRARRATKMSQGVRRGSTSLPPMRWHFRHLLRYRPEIAFAVHEVPKTLPHPGDADLQPLLQLGRYLLGAQKLGIMIRKTHDPEHLDAYTDADWSGDSITERAPSGGEHQVG